MLNAGWQPIRARRVGHSTVIDHFHNSLVQLRKRVWRSTGGTPFSLANYRCGQGTKESEPSELICYDLVLYHCSPKRTPPRVPPQTIPSPRTYPIDSEK
eukprot:2755984-Amphidinium_carterae.1